MHNRAVIRRPSKDANLFRERKISVHPVYGNRHESGLLPHGGEHSATVTVLRDEPEDYSYRSTFSRFGFEQGSISLKKNIYIYIYEIL